MIVVKNMQVDAQQELIDWQNDDNLTHYFNNGNLLNQLIILCS